MKKRKVLIAVIIVLLLIAAAVAGVFIYRKNHDDTPEGSGRLVYVESVKSVAGMGSVGLSSRFMGVVEAQESKSVQKDSDKTIKEIFVNVGDSVNEGDMLFSYDTSEMQLKLEELNLEYQAIENSIASYKTTLTDLNNQREKAETEDDKLSYTSQINSVTAALNEEEYNLSVKDLEITRQKDAMENSIVYAPMTGTIKEIKEDDGDNNDYYGYYGGYGDESGSGFITIAGDGQYRVKGSVDEQNVYSLVQGTPVIIRSRVNEDEIWSGTVSKIDMENQQNNNNNYYYDYGGGYETTSKYSFYVELDTTEGLMLGQHLYVELDNGMSTPKDGLYIPEYYIMQKDGKAYVWKQNSKKLIEKAEVELGEYDENRMSYEILSGLDKDDFIAYPEKYIKEGDNCTTDYEDVMKQLEDEGYFDDMEEDGEYTDDGYYDDGYYDDGYYEDGEYIDDGSYDDGAWSPDYYYGPDGYYDTDGVFHTYEEMYGDGGDDTVIYDGADVGDGTGDEEDWMNEPATSGTEAEEVK